MIMREFNKEYQVLDYSITQTNGAINLKWKYRQGKYFFIFLYDARNILSLEKIIQELEEGTDDRGLLEKTSVPLYTTKNEKEKIFLCREAEYIQRGHQYSVPTGGLQKGVPYALSIFVGDYDKEDGVFSIYPVKDLDSNTQFLPVKVMTNVSYNTGLSRIFSKTKICTLKIPSMYDYPDGALEYYVTNSGINMAYPIPAACLGREVFVEIPKDSEVIVRVANDYKKYYKV